MHINLMKRFLYEKVLSEVLIFDYWDQNTHYIFSILSHVNTMDKID